jgi:hypothetical protein
MIKVTLTAVLGAVAMVMALVFGCDGNYTAPAVVAPIVSAPMPLCNAACKRDVDAEEAQDKADADYQREMRVTQSQLDRALCASPCLQAWGQAKHLR